MAGLMYLTQRFKTRCRISWHRGCATYQKYSRRSRREWWWWGAWGLGSCPTPFVALRGAQALRSWHTGHCIWSFARRRQRLAELFEAALRSSRFQSWLGDGDADCSWLAGRLGDVYLHETLISHIRYCLDHRYPRRTSGETRKQFARRMVKVVSFLNSDDFAARDGGGLAALALSLHRRCAQVVELEGGRLRT